MTVVTPIVRRNVDLPDMFEPVMSTPSPRRSVIVFGTASSTSGWRTSVSRADVPGARKRRPGPIASTRAQRGDADRAVDLADRGDQAEECRSARAKLVGTEVDPVGVEEKQQIQVLVERASRRSLTSIANGLECIGSMNGSPLTHRAIVFKRPRHGASDRKRADQRLDIVSLEKLQRLTGRDHWSKLSKRSRRCADAKIGQIAHDQVDDEGGDERRYVPAARRVRGQPTPSSRPSELGTGRTTV